MVMPPKVLKGQCHCFPLLAFYMTTMADTSTENAVQAASTHDTDNLEQPHEQLEVDEDGIPTKTSPILLALSYGSPWPLYALHIFSMA